ncbi:hypothetical protein QYF36_025712 [Acer negundo]|nr:hypothetical protein QYF36_025712 [Acer negundo]
MKPDHLQAALAGNVAASPFCHINDPTKIDIFHKVSPSGNSLLHVAASRGHINIIELMKLRFPDLILKKNSKGDTALHVAVRAGDLKTVNKLIECAEEIPSSSSTTYYESLLNWKHCFARSSISARRIKEKFALKILKEQKVRLLNVRGEKGNTPLHCASSLGYFEGVRYLVKINSDLAFERNKEGFYPLHLAWEDGYVRVVQELLRKWPDPTELIGDNGQSILHVAAKNGKDELVRFLLKQDALHHRSMVVASLLWNKRLNPDLANYHGLTTYDICQANDVPGKVLDQQIDINDGNLKASENANQKNSAVVNLKFRSKDFQKMMTLSILFMHHEFFRRWCIIRRHQHNSSTRWSRMKYKPQFRIQDLNNTINNLFVEAALLVAAAYSGALQIPIKSDKDYTGRLCSYLITTIISMNLSITAALTLCLVLLLDTNLTLLFVPIAFLLLELAFAFLGYAFYEATGSNGNSI